jgi:hypothetical protein
MNYKTHAMVSKNCDFLKKTKILEKSQKNVGLMQAMKLQQVLFCAF